jgi:hypothetical protein
MIQPNRISRIVFKEQSGLLPDERHLYRQLAGAGITLADLAWAVEVLRSSIKQYGMQNPEVHVLDQQVSIESEERFFYDLIHYSPSGSKAFAQSVAAQIGSLIEAGEVCTTYSSSVQPK